MTTNLFEGIRLRDEGIASVASHNQVPFLGAIRERAAQLAEENGTVGADELRAWADERGIAPDHPNAWGAVFRLCPRDGRRWVECGRRKSNWTSAHARKITIWQMYSDAK